VTFDRRAYAREYARKRHAAKLAAANQGARTCQHRHGPGICGAVLETVVERGTGRTVVRCPACERRLRGICRTCPRPVAGRVRSAVYCAECKERAQREQQEAYARRNVEEKRRRERERHRALDAEARARKNAQKRLWRKANPDKVRQQKRREALRQHPRHLAYHRDYNRRRAAVKRDEMREKYYATHPKPQPACASCARAIPWEGRGAGGNVGRPPVRCVFCDARERPHAIRAAVKRWAARDERDVVKPVPVKVRPWRPKVPTPRLPTGERLCLTPGCTTVMRGREKKCEPCKAEAFVAARRALLGVSPTSSEAA
jgi:hypothetical protein